MPQARIAMRAIHSRRAFSKDLILANYGDKLTLRGFRIDHPERIELERQNTSDDWMTLVQEMPGRVPNTNPQLTGFIYHLKNAWQNVIRLQEEGDFENRAGGEAQRALNIIGQLHKWLTQQGDDRADIMAGLEGEGAANNDGWSDDAGCIADLCRKVLLVMGAVQEDVIQ